MRLSSDCGINGLYNGCTKECIMFKKWLDSTAYDVGNVLVELIDNSFEANTIDYEMEICLDDAIDIVKRGGV